MFKKDIRIAGQTPDGARLFSPDVNIYTPDQFYRTGDGKIHLDVNVAGSLVTLPVLNVGKESPVWVAYAHVIENQPLADASRIGLYSRLEAHLRPIVATLGRGEYITLISPPSDKTEELFFILYEDLAATFGEQLQYAQLIGGYNKKEVERQAAPDTVLPCDSVITKARGLHKFIAAKEAQAALIKNTKLVIGLDDIATTETTVNQMTKLTHRVGYRQSSSIQFFVIGTESVWGQEYPKKFPPNIHYFFQIPEVVGDLGPVHGITQ
ncbi:hypothetical protein KKB64_02515 [Patescibacteria group bacterium]|nr:hypothetical protein [Patescibacteria group bacterium]MBU2460151.1 hypothetical protein [Patescibacteria group bacterium]MBU2544424.1 hypothetical protein [Patescibacteria group bacterium]